MKYFRFLVFLCILVVVQLAFASQAKEGDLRFEPYLFVASTGQTIQAELGKLTVREKHGDPDSSLIDLALVRFRSTATSPGSPIVYLAGGPGGSGIDAARGDRFPLFQALREIGDVIALDQRGTGMSSPDLDCPQKLKLSSSKDYSKQEILDILNKKVRACSSFWKGKGVVLSAYNTNESADDIEDLRIALKAQRLHLWGISYGTHLALATIRRHGENIDHVILAGVEGPDHTYKLPSQTQKQLKRIYRMIRSDAQASAVVPDFLQWLSDELNSLEKTPVTQEVFDARKQQNVNVRFGSFEFGNLVSKSLTREAIPHFPQLIYQMSQGDYSFVASAILEERNEGIGSAMSLAMDCASGASAKRKNKIRRQESRTLLGTLIDFPFPDICDAIGVPDLGPEFHKPVHSDVPVLFISGSIDYRTPFNNAKQIKKGFPNGRHLLISGAGHDELLTSSPEILEVMLQFLKDQSLSTTKIVLPPIQFFPVQ